MTVGRIVDVDRHDNILSSAPSIDTFGLKDERDRMIKPTKTVGRKLQ